MIPSWDEYKEELKGLGNAILEKDESPDPEIKEKIDSFFRIVANIIFLIVAILLLGGSICVVILKYGLNNIPFSNISINVQITASLLFLFGLIVFLRILFWLKQYIQMYKLLRVYVVIEFVLMLKGFYQQSSYISRGSRNNAATVPANTIASNNEPNDPIYTNRINVSENIGKPYIKGYSDSASTKIRVNVVDSKSVNINYNPHLKPLSDAVIVNLKNPVQQVVRLDSIQMSHINQSLFNQQQIAERDSILGRLEPMLITMIKKIEELVK